jgi:hypothetical protein
MARGKAKQKAETRDQALYRLVLEAVEANGPIDAETINLALIDLDFEPAEAAEVSEVFLVVEQDLAKAKAEADDQNDESEEEPGLSPAGPPQQFPTVLYKMDALPLKVNDEAEHAAALRAGYRCFDDFPLEEQRVLHPGTTLE